MIAEPSPSRSPLALALLVLLACCASCFVGISHPVQNINEGIYARVAQEMLEQRQWLVPTLDGVPYLEKPPLLYWVTAGAYWLLGTSEATTRAAPIIGAILALTAVFRFARRHLAPFADGAAVLMLASAPIVIVMTRTLMFDMLFAGLLAWALVAAFDTMQEPANRAWVRASYAALALAVLTKGLAALVLFGAIVGAYLVLEGRDRAARMRALLDPAAVAIFLGIAVPWHVAAARAQPGFAWFYFVNEHVMRFVDRRVPHDYQTGPWWYYLPRLAGYAFPWSLLALLAPLVPKLPRGDPRHAPRTFLWIAFVVPLVVFSLSRAKGNYYMLIATPALVLLLADTLVRLRNRARALAVLPAAWIVVLAVAAVFDPARVLPYAVPADAGLWIFASAVAATLSLVAFANRWLAPALVLCAAASLPATMMFERFLDVNETLESSRSLALALKQSDRDEVYVFRRYEDLSALAYYLDRPLGVVASRSADLWYGMKLRPDASRFPTVSRLSEFARREHVALVVSKHDLRHFNESQLASEFRLTRVIGRFSVYLSMPVLQTASLLERSR